MFDIALKRFRLIGMAFVASLIFLIWVGSFVRSTGSGMGCPDWPKCFGMWIPPTDVSQLPADYQVRYAESYGTTTFNAFKTWTEYINRLITGVVSALAILTVLFAFPLRRWNKHIFNLALTAFGLILMEAVIGAIVVQKNLHTGTVTIHAFIALMALAVAVSAVLLAFATPARPAEDRPVPLFSFTPAWLGLATTLVVLTQMMIGTKVRENVDLVGKVLGESNRSAWVANLGDYYTIHRFFYYVVAIVIFWGVWRLRKENFYRSAAIRLFAMAAAVFLVCEILFGISLARFGLPPVLQPLHLLFAVLIFTSAYLTTALLYLAARGRLPIRSELSAAGVKPVYS